MTLTDWPRTAAEPDSASAPPAAVSGTPEPVSQTPGVVSDVQDFVSETENGTGTDSSPAKLTGTQKWTTGAIVIAALALAGIGLYLSFEHVAEFAFEELRFGSLGKGQLFAVGVDVGIMVMIAVDLLMAWLKRPISWIRYPVWLLTAATVILNAASGAPEGAWKFIDYVAAGAHGVVPVLFITVVELGRDAIDRVVRPEQAERDSIPLLRWILAPVATARIFRRMRLWGVASYPEMVRRDQDLIAYEQWLTRKHDGDLSRASEDERLPMTMAPYGYTVAQALALPEQQESDAEKRAEDKERRLLDAATRKEIAHKRAEAERLEADGELEAVRARVDGETGQARAHAKAQVGAAERAATLEQEALDSAVVAEARAREAEAARKEAQERETEAEADLRAAEKRKLAAEADRIAAAEAQAVETRTVAEARKAAAEANRAAAETEKAAAETRRATAEADRRTQEENARQEAALAQQLASRAAAAEAELRAAEARLAAAEIERRAVETEDAARLTPRERSVRKVARMAFAAGLSVDGLAAEDVHHELCDLISIADVQRELAVSSTDTASKYRQEAAAVIVHGYRP